PLRDDRPSLLPALVDESARAVVVLAGLSGAQSLSALRTLEFRLVPRAPGLSLPLRALAAQCRAIARLVHRLRLLRAPLRDARLPQPPAANDCRAWRRDERRLGAASATRDPLLARTLG